ncbi:alpha-amylase family glycosyl hydrolase [Neolewinella antarctica]|uniref:Glycosidase n=1 Tax=Neolewinella antarctica TaxID=442734 RepID=A0ABX0XC07_9BACT|nr:alpha-amylase family glycosyl hydrolase [Neolewinella antarctica]NJC26798.1 glycosidase [Neolewinella antarctica]
MYSIDNVPHTLLFLLLLCTCASACESNPSAGVEVAETVREVSDLAVEPNLPDWHKTAAIYEVNLRHFTPEGTFAAFEQHLPRLAEMGVDVLWFMPVHPVSVEKRKGELGSPYAVADYRDVNPDFGTMDDFKHMLATIHESGMYAIIDWVPNHTGWDNPWITDHPDWYTQKDGQITDPINPETGESWGWTDVADLNFDNKEMRLGMIDAMSFWLRDVGIDGFRVDVAHGVPVDFWEEATTALYAIKPTFLLAEAEVPAIVNDGAFLVDYGWEMHHLLNGIAKTQGANRAAKTDAANIARQEGEDLERVTALDIDKLLAEKHEKYQRGYQMQFTSNHDENSWSGTEFQRFGAGHQAFAVLTATFDGMPLIYTGQESAVDKQYEFFKKDEIDWGDYQYADFYKTLFDLKENNEALWNGEYGGELVKIATGNDENIYAFTREKNGDRVIVMINLSAQPQTFELGSGMVAGTYKDVFTENPVALGEADVQKLGAWEYLALSN